MVTFQVAWMLSAHVVNRSPSATRARMREPDGTGDTNRTRLSP